MTAASCLAWRNRAARPDRGASTIWVVGMCAVVTAAAVVVVGLALAITARHRAESAADLAALAGAVAGSTSADPCPQARRAAEANGARLVSCTVSGAEVEVVTSVAAPTWLVRVVSEARGAARAGPAMGWSP